MGKAYVFARLAAIVWPGSYDPTQRVMAVFKAYYDASGKEKTPGRVVVAGVLATVEKWAGFERSWDKVLTEYGISFHHHKDYVASNGDYAKWGKAVGSPEHPAREAYFRALLR